MTKIIIIWKYINNYLYEFSSSVSEWLLIINISIGYGNLMIFNDQFFVFGVDSYNSQNLLMSKITYSSTSADWTNQIACSNTWSASRSESVLSSDKSTIYSLFVFGLTSQTTYLYFAGFSVSDGRVVTARYKSTVFILNVLGSSLNGDYLVNLKFYYFQLLTLVAFKL